MVGLEEMYFATESSGPDAIFLRLSQTDAESNVDKDEITAAHINSIMSSPQSHDSLFVKNIIRSIAELRESAIEPDAGEDVRKLYDTLTRGISRQTLTNMREIEIESLNVIDLVTSIREEKIKGIRYSEGAQVIDGGFSKS